MHKLTPKQLREQRMLRDLALIQDMRDDCIALIKNSGLSFKEIHERGGPTTQTISKWYHRETLTPRLQTIRSVLQVLGYELQIVTQAQFRRISVDG